MIRALLEAWMLRAKLFVPSCAHRRIAPRSSLKTARAKLRARDLELADCIGFDFLRLAGRHVRGKQGGVGNDHYHLRALSAFLENITGLEGHVEGFRATNDDLARPGQIKVEQGERRDHERGHHSCRSEHPSCFLSRSRTVRLRPTD